MLAPCHKALVRLRVFGGMRDADMPRARVSVIALELDADTAAIVVELVHKVVPLE